MAAAPDWKKLAAAAAPTTRRVSLCLRGDLLADLEDATAKAGKAAADDPAVVELRRQVDEATVEFTLRGLTRQKYRATEAAHAAKDGSAGWDLDTFPEALIRACVVDPVIDAEDPFIDILTPGQVERLFDAAFSVCNEVTDAPLRVRG